MHQLSKAWYMGNEANLYLLNAIEDRYLGDRYTRNSRPVAAQFAHMHNFRLRWLSHAATDLAEEVAQFPRGASLSKEDLIQALYSSSEVMAVYLDRCEVSGEIESWDGPPASFLAYVIAHEAHHRGLVMAALHACGHQPPEEVIYGLWEWN